MTTDPKTEAMLKAAEERRARPVKWRSPNETERKWLGRQRPLVLSVRLGLATQVVHDRLAQVDEQVRSFDEVSRFP